MGPPFFLRLKKDVVRNREFKIRKMLCREPKMFFLKPLTHPEAEKVFFTALDMSMALKKLFLLPCTFERFQKKVFCCPDPLKGSKKVFFAALQL